MPQKKTFLIYVLFNQQVKDMEHVYYEDQMEKNQELHQLNVEHLKASTAKNQAITKRENKMTEFFEGFFDSNKHILTDGPFNLQFKLLSLSHLNS